MLRYEWCLFVAAMGGDVTAAVELATLDRDCVRLRGALLGPGAVGSEQSSRAHPRPHAYVYLLHR